MTDGEVADEAFTLAEMAPDDSVTMAILAGRESQFSKTAPLHEPPVSYLDGTEAPAYVLTNAKRGIGLGNKGNTVAPDGDRRTVVLVTGRRTLCLVGQQDGDEVIEIPHESVAATKYSRGLRKHRLVLRTPRSAYHCWVHRKTEVDLLERVTEFIGDHQQEEPETVSDDSAGRVMWRGRPVKRDTGAGDSADEPAEEERTSDESDESAGQPMWRGRPVNGDAGAGGDGTN
ncbi:hypothetical protein [Halorientalis litorea]|jgi:hypothetical protein|uniref:hypothetical protein n=1 Tax=Halorientalis litorea TaxID=2931977 RepID=UPI001FF46CBE|nr:hypothetical protein [Halorientalis litorea]